MSVNPADFDSERDYDETVEFVRSVEGSTQPGEREGCEVCELAAELAEERNRLRVRVNELEREVERYRDRAVCSGCGQDVTEGGACETRGCYRGEMIPSSDLPSAFLTALREANDTADEWRDENSALRSRLQEAEAEAENLLSLLRLSNATSKRRGERLQEAERALAFYANECHWIESGDTDDPRTSWGEGIIEAHLDKGDRARAVLAGGEHQGPTEGGDDVEEDHDR